MRLKDNNTKEQTKENFINAIMYKKAEQIALDVILEHTEDKILRQAKDDKDVFKSCNIDVLSF